MSKCPDSNLIIGIACLAPLLQPKRCCSRSIQVALRKPQRKSVPNRVRYKRLWSQYALAPGQVLSESDISECLNCIHFIAPQERRSRWPPHTHRLDMNRHRHTVHLLSIFGAKYHFKGLPNYHVPGFASLNISSFLFFEFLNFGRQNGSKNEARAR